MPQMRINADAIGWEEPNPVTGQPPVYRSGRRGEVLEVPDHVIAQKRDETVLVHYPAPAGSNVALARYEPVLLDPNPDAGEIETRAAQDAEIAELRERLATLEATRQPLTADAPLGTPVPPNPVVLTPRTTGTRLVATTEEAAQDAVLAAGASMPGPVTIDASTGEPGVTAGTIVVGEPGVQPSPGAALAGTGDRASDLVALLSQQPQLADAVEAQEQRRTDPRPTVLRAVAQARGQLTAQPAEGAAGTSDGGGDSGSAAPAPAEAQPGAGATPAPTPAPTPTPTGGTPPAPGAPGVVPAPGAPTA